MHIGMDVLVEQVRVVATLGMDRFPYMSPSPGAATCSGPVSMAATMLVTIRIVAAIVCVFAVAMASVGVDCTNTPNFLVVLVYITGYMPVMGFKVALTLEDKEMNSKTMNI